MAIQSVSFGKQAVTKKGNPYEKTNLGGKIGTTVGAGTAAFCGAKFYSKIKKLNEVMLSLGTETEFVASRISTIKKIALPLGLVMAGLTVLAGFGVGKIADAITNKVRANKADS